MSVDSARKDSVVVRFHEDGSRYWLPLSDVQTWLKETYPLRESCTGKASDEFAASVLLELWGYKGKLVEQSIVEEK